MKESLYTSISLGLFVLGLGAASTAFAEQPQTDCSSGTCDDGTCSAAVQLDSTVSRKPSS